MHSTEYVLGDRRQTSSSQSQADPAQKRITAHQDMGKRRAADGHGEPVYLEESGVAKVS